MIILPRKLRRYSLLEFKISTTSMIIIKIFNANHVLCMNNVIKYQQF